MNYLFTLLIVASGTHKFLILIKSHVYIFFLLLSVLWESWLRNHCFTRSPRDCPCVSVFLVLALRYRSSIYFGLISVYGVTSFSCMWISHIIYLLAL